MTSDACREWRGALASHALGHIEPEEEIGLRAHLDGWEDCRAEMRELYESLNLATDGTLHIESEYLVSVIQR